MAAAATVLVCGTAAEAVPPQGQTVLTDVGGECDPPAPAALDPLLTGSPPLRLRMQLLVEGVPAERVQDIQASMRASYRQAGIDLVSTVRPAAGFSGTDALSLIDQIRPMHATRGPADVTHLLTFRDLTYNGSKSLVGLADCIGGVANPDRALAVSEVTQFLDDAYLLYRYGAGRGDAAANVATHEVGHLLGARHEHSDCASGASFPAAAEPEEAPTPCSVMFLAAPTSGVFGPVEILVARGYVSTFVPQG